LVKSIFKYSRFLLEGKKERRKEGKKEKRKEGNGIVHLLMRTEFLAVDIIFINS